MDILRAENVRTLRATILGLVYDNHARQYTRLSHVTLMGALERLFVEISRDDLFTVLDDLLERGYLNFKKVRDRQTGRTSIAQIQITPKGRDLVERTTTDPAVQFE